MIAGFGTVALEILEQVPLVDAVIVPVGSGGLIAGIATVVKSMKPDCLVYGVQTEKMPGFFKSLEKGEPVTIGVESTMAPNIGVAYVGTNAFHIAKSLVDKMVTILYQYISVQRMKLRRCE
ncbi:Serine racemase, partial [Eumeta japonica]